MAVTIVSTVGGASSNSYVTQAEATSYLEGRLNASAWETSASSDSKNRALVEAARELNTRGYVGTKAADAQALQWPRQSATDPDASWQSTFYSTDEIPQRIKDAQCELALEFLKAGTTDLAALPSTDGVTEKTVDVLTTRYAEPSQRQSGLARYPRVMSLIAPLLESATGALRIVRG